MRFGSTTWTSPAWLAEAGEWIDESLAGQGLSRTGPIDQQRVRAWSTNLLVPCAQAPGGRVWFKACTERSAYEPALVGALAAVAPSAVASPIAADAERGWLLSLDEGPTFRDVVRNETLLTSSARVLQRYAELQVTVAESAAAWSHLGVPAYRPHDLVAAWQERAGLVDGRRGTRTLEAAADRLAAVPLPATVQHDDLHTGNVFVGTDDPESLDAARFFDWGDAYIGHPFCSLLIGLRCVAYQLDIELQPAERERLVDAYLDPWTEFGSRRQLRALVPDAMLLARIGRVLGWERAMLHATEGEHLEWDEHPQTWLAEATTLAALGSKESPIEDSER